MKLHIAPVSPNSRKVMAVINYLDLDVEIVPGDVLAGDFRRPNYLMINPMGKVPALEDGEFKLWESNAIMQYLADKVPGNTLFPVDPARRADIVRWQFWGVSHYNPPLGTMIWQRVVRPMFLKEQGDETRVEDALEDFRRYAPVLEEQLAGRSFVTGEDVTLADFELGAAAAFVGPAGVPLDSYPSIGAWYARLDTVKGWQDTAPPFALEAA